MPESSKIRGEITIPRELFLEIKNNVDSTTSFKKKLEEVLDENISKVLEVILAGGIVLGSSDIHIEPEEDSAKLRLRVDGVLQDVFFFNRKTYDSFLSRIKLLSGVKLNITQKSQDGRFTIVTPELLIGRRGISIKKDDEEMIEVRASTLPSEYGETIVLRILNPKGLVDIEDLGLRKGLKEMFENEIKKPNGMIILTGPTGSGKTTTLYAILKNIRKPEIKIVTIEDPIEYHLKGISQTEVHKEKGYDFASGLRSIVRQDPDVILVGEIRDFETAQIALQAALTGHLVLSTLHTNDAAGTIPRLQALGEKPYNIGPALNAVIAQRLVRKVCQCSEKTEMSEDEYQKISSALKDVPQDIVSYSKETKIPRKAGCSKCNKTGYKGRIGIFEMLLVDDDMENLILSSPSSVDIKRKAIENGMLTVYQEGVIKVLNGETTLDEVERVAVF